MKVLAVCTGKPRPTPAKSGLTGHFKDPMQGPVMVHENGVAGDTICDLDNHGGVDQAVYVFGKADQDWWAARWNRDLTPGYFGENLLVSDLESSTLCIGDVLEVNDVLLQITSPRIPCATYQSHIGSPTAIRDFLAAGRPGAYARVLAPGPVQSGDAVTITPFAGDRISVVALMADYVAGHKDAAFLARLLTVPAHFKSHAIARARLAR